MIYGFIGYVLYVEYTLQGKTCSTISFNEGKSGNISIVAKPDDSCDMFLAQAIGLKQTVIEVRSAHYYFLTLLIVKELLVYILCVRRAGAKLRNELVDEGSDSKYVRQRD